MCGCLSQWVSYFWSDWLASLQHTQQILPEVPLSCCQCTRSWDIWKRKQPYSYLSSLCVVWSLSFSDFVSFMQLKEWVQRFPFICFETKATHFLWPQSCKDFTHALSIWAPLKLMQIRMCKLVLLNSYASRLKFRWSWMKGKWHKSTSTHLPKMTFTIDVLPMQRNFPLYCFYTYQITYKSHKLLYIIRKHNKNVTPHNFDLVSNSRLSLRGWKENYSCYTF